MKVQTIWQICLVPVFVLAVSCTQKNNPETPPSKASEKNTAVVEKDAETAPLPINGEHSKGLACDQVIVNAAAEGFRYADGVSTTGGQFSASYPASNLMNNGFTDATDTIDTRSIYLAAGNNYASLSGTIANFDLIFEFNQPSNLTGIHVWNYVYRNSAGGAASTAIGVKDYTLTFYDGAGGTGSVIGSAFSAALLPAQYDALNPAQSVQFPTTYRNARSVVMRVTSNHGSKACTGMNELAFSVDTQAIPGIQSFTASAPFVQRPATPVLSWTVTGPITSLRITPGIGDVLPLTTAGSGSLSVSPIGEQTYTLLLNGKLQQSVSVVGLPSKDKLHLYLLIGQSNMQGIGSPYNRILDAPHPRVVKFGSRDGMEPLFVQGGHSLVQLSSEGGGVGMGIEFGKSIIAAQTDPEIVVCLINHARASSAIQWWEPGVINNKQVNPLTGQNYKLYDEAVERVKAASNYGVLKGMLWHQGEYNSVNNTNPDSDPEGYAARLRALVTNLRTSFSNPRLPFVCGEFVPASWIDDDGSTILFNGLPHRGSVEAALMDLPHQLPRTYAVSNDGLRGITGNLIHFDAASQRELGRRYAAALFASSINLPPVANAGTDRGVATNTAVVLDGRGSSDPDNDPSPLSYNWTQIGGASVTLSNASTAQPGFTPTAAGVYTFRLMVSDGAATSVDDVVITAAKPTNLLSNGDFTCCGKAWRARFTAPACGSVAMSSCGAKFRINTKGTLDWHIQLYQTIPVTAGQIYNYSFTARKCNPGTRAIHFVVETDAAPYTRDINHPITIDETLKPYSGSFTASSSRRVRIEIMAGLSDLDFEVNNFSVTQ